MRPVRHVLPMSSAVFLMVRMGEFREKRADHE